MRSAELHAALAAEAEHGGGYDYTGNGGLFVARTLAGLRGLGHEQRLLGQFGITGRAHEADVTLCPRTEVTRLEIADGRIRRAFTTRGT